MSKKSFFGGSSDENDKAADKGDDASKSNPSAAGSQDPNLATSPSDPNAARPTNILRDDRSPETDDGSVNPHNEAMAQKPVADPLDRVGDNQDRLRRPKTDKDRADALKEWGRKARSRGNVMSADWEEFQELTGERQPAPTPESIREAEQKQQSRAAADSADASQHAAGRRAGRESP